MFPENTVIILGAGASAEFGLPTGANLFQKLLKENPLGSQREFMNGSNLSSYDLKSAIIKTFNMYSSDKFNNELFIKKAKKTFETSIDLFAYNNTSVLNAAKFFTCWHVGASMIKCQKKPGRYGDYYDVWEYDSSWSLPYIEGKRNYIAEVAKKIVESSDGVSDISENLSVVSFNYDMIFEKSLGEFISSSDRYSDVKHLYMPNVQYVYGSIPFYENVQPQFIAKDYEKIKFMMELSCNDINIKNIREKVLSADYIYLLGFSLDPVNVELIGISESKAQKFSVCYDGNFETISRLSKIGVDLDKNCLVGSEDAPIGLSKAASLGLFSMHEFQ
ncbi:hypothetical protein OCEANICA350_11504 [Oceanicaulis sp. 350]|nr:hypothetical protein OCEANICA350_11504 [Oceanicaulis sp. 350]